MHFTSITTALILATAVSALPSSLAKRVDAIPLAIYSGLGCNSNPIPLTTAFVPTDGACFGISPIVSGNTDSGIIDQTLLKTLPKGCTLVAFSDYECTSVNRIVYDVTGQCATFGPGKLIRGAKAVGTCA